jgi:hypothetical protein
MQLLWHCLVNMSLGYLMLIASVRIVQEVTVLCSSMSKRQPGPSLFGKTR